MPIRDNSKLLAKFDKVTTDTTSKLDPEDKVFCESLQKGFNAARKRLLAKTEQIEKLYAEEEKGYKQLEKYTSWNDHIQFRVSKKDGKIRQGYQEFEWLDFTFAYDLVYLYKSMENLIYVFSNRVKNHFKAKYVLPIENENYDNLFYDEVTKEVIRDPHYMVVVERIMNDMNSSDFIDIAKNKVYDETNSLLRYTDIKQVKNTLVFKKVFGFGRGETRWRWEHRRMARLRTGIHLFEDGKTLADPYPDEVEENSYIPFEVTTDFKNTTKVLSWYVRKGGGLTLTFAEPEYIKDFCETFRLTYDQ